MTLSGMGPRIGGPIPCRRKPAGKRSCSPDRIRTGVSGLKGRRPRPLDDGTGCRRKVTPSRRSAQLSASPVDSLQGLVPAQGRDRFEQGWAHRRAGHRDPKRLKDLSGADSELFGEGAQGALDRDDLPGLGTCDRGAAPPRGPPPPRLSASPSPRTRRRTRRSPRRGRRPGPRPREGAWSSPGPTVPLRRKCAHSSGSRLRPSTSSTNGRTMSAKAPASMALMYSPFIQVSLSGSNAAGLRETSDEVELLHGQRPIEDRGLAVGRPPQDRQVVEDGVGKEPRLPILRQRRRPVPFRQLLPVGPEEERQMGVDRGLSAQGPGEQDVLRGGGEEVLTTGDVGDLVVDVVDHRRQVIGGGAVAAQDDEVVDVGGGEREVSPDDVVELDGAVLRDRQTDDAIVTFDVGTTDVVPRVPSLAPGPAAEVHRALREIDRRSRRAPTPPRILRAPHSGRAGRSGGRCHAAPRPRCPRPSRARASGTNERISSSNSFVDRSRSVSSMRTMNVPPVCRA